ncbi:MAG: hypothetical protein WB402_02660 [Sulfuricaulis sp.]|uniref:hypothetical protein n=1 Tax=Sulfuricaulis sp. TaxID=2003553 RepID=UPI003C444EAC
MPGINLNAHLVRPRENQGDAPRPPPGRDRYVNQFILGPAFAEQLADWQRITVGRGLKLTAHPDLACTQATDGGRELTLIGHILDPLAPEASNDDIVRALLHHFTSRNSLIAATNRFGGRWLLLATSAEESFLFHDALGLRQAFYTDPVVTGAIWVVSQAGIASEMLSLTPDEQALDYLDTQTFRRTFESRLPAAASTFKGLKHLLPNHWLNLSTGRSHRYWPSAPLEAMTPETAIDRIGTLMSGQIRAAATRFDLALSLTAGFDSRLMLATAREVADRICVMTLRQGRMPDHFPDIEIPARLLKQVGLPHVVIHATSTMTPEFSLQFKRNVYLAHDHYGHDAEAILRHFGRTKAVLTGSGAEVGRCAFRRKLPHADHVRFTPELLAWLEYGSTHPFLVEHFREWLAEVSQQHYVKLLDLLEWEQDYGNWLAMTQLEFDIAWREIFTPYNCRQVLATLLGVDERFRKAPDYLLFQRAIQKAWPELLSEPINPHRTIGRRSLWISDMKAVIHYWRFLYAQHKQNKHRR